MIPVALASCSRSQVRPGHGGINGFGITVEAEAIAEDVLFCWLSLV